MSDYIQFPPNPADNAAREWDGVWTDDTPVIAVTSQENDFGAIGDAALTAAGAASEAALATVQDRLRRILEDRRDVKVGALLGYADSFNLQELLEVVGSRAVAIGQEVLQQLQTSFVEIASDPAVIEAVAQLRIVQQTAATINNLASIYNAGVRLANAIDPILPYAEIITTAGGLFSNPAGAGELGIRARDIAVQALQKLGPLLLRDIKNYVFNIELKNIPAFVLGAVAEASTGGPQLGIGEWVTQLDAEAQVVSNQSTWRTGLQNTLGAVRNPVVGNTRIPLEELAGSPQPFQSSVLWLGTQAFVNHNLARNEYLQSLLSATWGGIAGGLYGVANAIGRLEEQVEDGTLSGVDPNPYSDAVADLVAQSLTEYDLIRISKSIIEARDTSAAFFTNRQMFQLLIEELKNDGALINIATGSYDEALTDAMGTANRKLFKQINDRITRAHEALAALVGEVHPNITETIPVVDYYDVQNTHIANRYVDAAYSQIDVIPEWDLDENNNQASPILWDPVSEYTHPSIINLGIFNHPFAEYFYGDRRRGTSANDLVVTSNISRDVVEAPGLLAGFWSTPVEESREGGEETGKPRQWLWLDNRTEAAANGIPNFPRGVKYQPYHILEKGAIVARPLEYENAPGQTYEGLAFATYDQSQSLISTLRTNHTVPLVNWMMQPFNKIEKTVISESQRAELLFRTKVHNLIDDFTVGDLWNGQISGDGQTLVIDLDATPGLGKVTVIETNGNTEADRVAARQRASTAIENDLAAVNAFWQPSSSEIAQNVYMIGLLKYTDTTLGLAFYEVASVSVVTPLALIAATGAPGSARRVTRVRQVRVFINAVATAVSKAAVAVVKAVATAVVAAAQAVQNFFTSRRWFW